MDRLSRFSGNNGFIAGTALLMAVFTAVMLLVIVFRTINHAKNNVIITNLSREQATVDGNIQYGLANLHKRISQNLSNRIIYGYNGNFIQDIDLQRYDQQNPALFWTEWMNNIPGEPNFEVVDSSVAAYTISDSSTNITVRLIYANDRLTSGGFATMLWNDFTLRYYYEIRCVQKTGTLAAGKTVTAKTYFFGDNQKDNSIQIRLWRALSAYNLWTEYCTLPDGVTPIYDNKSYSGQVYSRYCFFVDGSPVYSNTVHISEDALNDPAPANRNYFKHRTLDQAFSFVDNNGNNMLDSGHEVIPATANMSENTQRRIAYYGRDPGYDIPGGLTVNSVYGSTEALRMITGQIEISSTCIYVNGSAYINISCPGEQTTTYYSIQIPKGNEVYKATQYARMLQDPHMLIFVEGDLHIEGAITCNSKTTISSRDNIYLVGDLLYKDYSGSASKWLTTVIGLVAWNGHILFSKDVGSTGASFTMEIDAVFMAPNGGIGSENWQDLSSLPFLGTVQHYGCLIRKFCLPTLTADYQHGWAFQTNFDQYLENQKAPPYFPGNGRYKLDTDKLTVVDIYSRK